MKQHKCDYINLKKYIYYVNLLMFIKKIQNTGQNS